jgi:hypothetical protein
MAENNSDDPRTLEIRKYQDRRYYDGTRSLQQIHKLIIEGFFIYSAPGGGAWTASSSEGVG